MKDAHLRCKHGGLHLTLTTLRQFYWILFPRPQVKSVQSKCVPCVKIRAQLASQVMADLPRTRVTQPNKPNITAVESIMQDLCDYSW